MDSSRRGLLFACVSSFVIGCSAEPEPARPGDGGGDAASTAPDGGAPSEDGSGIDGAASDGAASDGAASDGSASDGSASDGSASDACACAASQRCVLGQCVRDLGACGTDDECQSDSYCREGVCVPYGVPADHRSNPMCRRTISIDALRPSVQCRWSGPPMGDPHPAHNQAMSTPVVVDLDLDDDRATLSPSIIFASFSVAGTYGGASVLRIIDGRDCRQQQTLSAANEQVVGTASPAVGDLDGDGRPEIVAVAFGGGLLGFRWDAATRRYARAWRSGTCAPSGTRTNDATGSGTWGGPSIHDLDDDGRPEIIHGGVVYNSDGCVLDATQGYPAYSHGVIPVVADVDSDGRMELVWGNRLFQWDGAMRRWVAESYFRGTALAAGQVAVGELGRFPLMSSGEDAPEVVVVSAGTVRVQTIEGTVVRGPFMVPGGGVSGPPTIADFDGDGRAEFATAGGARYVVFDLDCMPGGSAAGCNGMTRTDGVLWSQPSQDASSNVTGSSVFDFDADGRAEAVYADECYLRVYEGRTGRVVYSAARSSGTAYENPIIADVDGDFRSEIVSTVNDYAGALGCAARDPLFTSATFSVGHGVVVLRDEMDRWASSRPIWSQHAYHVTHVGDRGEIPRTSMVRQNWRSMGLNNFRQNVQGTLAALGRADLTVTAEPGPLVLMCVGDRGTLRARVCNRGTLPAPAGVVTSFRAESAAGMELCRATTSAPLAPESCVEVSCEGAFPPRTVDIVVRVNQGTPPADECLSMNNGTTIRAVYCATPG